jgi:hypothetical protein
MYIMSCKSKNNTYFMWTFLFIFRSHSCDNSQDNTTELWTVFSDGMSIFENLY